MNVLVLMSGGVDSSVTAHLLKSKGYNVTGITMRMDGCYESLNDLGLACANENSSSKAREIAKIIDIPFYEINVKDEFNKYVLDYLKDEYINGKTPNPCMMCNKFVKFGYFIEKATKMGIKFDKIASGHYAKVEYNEETKSFHLKKADNTEKDQSYFLSLLTQEQLSKIIFPLGYFKSKDEIWNIAKSIGLPFEEKKESQDFLGGNYQKVLNLEEKIGTIRLLDGTILGKHKGYWNYTKGQRKGLGVSYKEPLYVVKIDPKFNIVYVGVEKELYTDFMRVKDINFIEKIDFVGEVFDVKVRYRQNSVKCKINSFKKNMYYVDFFEKQKAVTLGQFAVFYKDDRVIAGGVIC